MLPSLFQPDGCQGLGRAPGSIRGIHTGVYQGEFDIFLCRVPGQQMGFLKDEADLMIPEARQFVWVDVRAVALAEQILPA
jgi:hypothetical protein